LLQCVALDGKGKPNNVARGAKVQNLRIAAGIGRTDLVENYFNADGSLKSEAGKINWPFGVLEKITGLHYAALNGHRAMVEFLLNHGADRNVKDTKIGSTAAGWADHGGRPDIRDLLS
jgi:hypothetical protein